ncbi:MAG: nuclear transport factor 2 family protein [Lentisphaeraceae bacterium]|nr:nuclear transport factor 2 family protein [Lentisphaeraceae bacterium]
MRSPEAAAQGQLDAYNNRDIETFCQFFTSDVKVFDLASGELLYEGQEAFHNRYKELFDSSPNLDCKLVGRLVCGNFVYDQEQVTGHASGANLHAVATYEVIDGLIKKVWFTKE